MVLTFVSWGAWSRGFNTTKFRVLTFLAGAVGSVFESYSNSNLFYFHFVTQLSIEVGMILALSGAVVWSSFDRKVSLSAVLYSIVMVLCWSVVATISSLSLLLVMMGCVFIVFQQRKLLSWCTPVLMILCILVAVVIPGSFGSLVGEYTKVQYGTLFAGFGGGLSALWFSMVFSHTTFPLWDTDLDNAIPLLEENLQKLRSLQRDLEETRTRLKRSMPSLN